MRHWSLRRFVLALLLILGVGSGVVFAQPFTAQIQLALQTMGLWGYGTYTNNQVPVWSAAQNKFLPGAGGGGGGTPGGALTSVQYNNAGAFGGFGTWDGTTLALGVGKRLSFAGTLAAFDLRASNDAVPYLQVGGDFPIARDSITAENGVPVAWHNSDFTLVNAGNGNYLNFFNSLGTVAAPLEIPNGGAVGTINFGAFYDDGGVGYYDFATGINAIVDADYSGFPNSYAVALQFVAWGQAANDYGSAMTLKTNGNISLGVGSAPERVALRATATNELSVVQPASTSTLATLRAAIGAFGNTTNGFDDANRLVRIHNNATTLAGGYVNGIWSNLVYTPSSGSDNGSVSSLNLDATIAGANNTTGYPTAIVANSWYTGTGSINSVRGISLGAIVSGAGTVGFAQAFGAGVSLAAGSTTTDGAYVYAIDTIILNGTLNNYFGFWTPPVTHASGSIANFYDFYITDHSSLTVAGNHYVFYYGGGKFTIDKNGKAGPTGVQYVSGAEPTCNAAARGTTWYVAGGAGVLDTFRLCRKDAADAYAWVSLF